MESQIAGTTPEPRLGALESPCHMNCELTARFMWRPDLQRLSLRDNTSSDVSRRVYLMTNYESRNFWGRLQSRDRQGAGSMNE